MRITLIGLPGSGKSTLAHILGGMFHLMTISSGDLARAHGFAGSDAEKKGELAPDENKIRNLVKEAIGGGNAYILDGFPRMVEQIEAVDIEIDVAIYIKTIDHGACIDRLIDRARPDDTPEIITSRIQTYIRHTHPLIGYFKKKGKLLTINGDCSMAELVGRTVCALSKFGLRQADLYIHDLLRRDFQGEEKKRDRRSCIDKEYRGKEQHKSS